MLDWLYVIVFSILTTILVEVINYFAVFSRDSFKTKKANLDRAKDRMESLRRANFEHSSGHKAGYQEKKIKLEQAEVDRFSAELQMDKLKTTAIQTVIQFIFTGMFHSYFEGRIMAKLPFNPPGFLRRITHRGLLGDDFTEISTTALFLLCSFSIKPIISRIMNLSVEIDLALPSDAQSLVPLLMKK